MKLIYHLKLEAEKTTPENLNLYRVEDLLLTIRNK